MPDWHSWRKDPWPITSQDLFVTNFPVEFLPSSWPSRQTNSQTTTHELLYVHIFYSLLLRKINNQVHCLKFLPLPLSLGPPQTMACAQSLSCVQLFAAPSIIVHGAPLSMGFPRQEYWKWVAITFPRAYSWPKDGNCISCVSCIAGGFFTTKPPRELRTIIVYSGIMPAYCQKLSINET